MTRRKTYLLADGDLELTESHVVSEVPTPLPVPPDMDV